MLHGHHQKLQYQSVENFQAYLHAKNQLHTDFFLKILQRNKTCYFGLFGPARPDTPKMTVPI